MDENPYKSPEAEVYVERRAVVRAEMSRGVAIVWLSMYVGMLLGISYAASGVLGVSWAMVAIVLVTIQYFFNLAVEKKERRGA